MFVCLSVFFFFSDNSDLIACMVVSKDGGQAQRFLAVDVYQMSLVEPETKRLGWGVVKFAGLLQVNETQRVPVCLCGSMCGSMCVHLSTAHLMYARSSSRHQPKQVILSDRSLTQIEWHQTISLVCVVLTHMLLSVILNVPFASTGHAGVWC